MSTGIPTRNWPRAVGISDRMERDGVVGAADGSKPRKVLIRPVGEMSGAQA